MRFHLTWLYPIIIAGFLLPPVSEAEEGSDDEEWLVSIYSLEEYKFRHATKAHLLNPDGTETVTESENDSDLRLFFGSNVTSPHDRFFADITLGAWVDADGAPSAGTSPSLGSQYDYSAPAKLDIYSLYAEYRDPCYISLARLGRQSAEHGRPATFDGGAFRARIIRHYLEVFAFGGRSVHFFNVGDNLFEDWIASGGLVIRPASFLKFEIDYRYLREDVPTETATTTPTPQMVIENHSYGISGWLYASDWFYLKAHLRGLDDQISRVGGSSMLVWDRIMMGLDLSGDVQLVDLQEVNELDDPYFAVLGQSQSNLRAHADIWKAFETKAGTYTLHGGWDGRILLSGSPTLFNRDYGKAYLWFEATDIAVKGPFASLMLSYHYTHAATNLGNDIKAILGGSIGWDRRPLRIEAGTYFSAVKYNYYQSVNELENVRTYFGEISYRILDWLSVKGKYEFERFDRDVHQAIISLAQMY